MKSSRACRTLTMQPWYYTIVDVGILAQKLQAMDVSATLIQWILALLGMRRCKMKFGGWRSEIFEVRSGLPQDSPLSSVLFNMYTTDLIEATQVQECSPYSYVDDLIITSLVCS